MKVVHVTTTIAGGAGRAALRLHNALLGLGVDSRILTLHPSAGIAGAASFDFPRALAPRARRWLRQKWQVWRRRAIAAAPKPAFEEFSLDSSSITGYWSNQIPPDAIIHLHWVSGFVDYLSFFRAAAGRRIVWTLHDMNPFTGGCHFDNRCGRFAQRCGACPQLGSTAETDLSRRIWQRKSRSFAGFGTSGLQLVSPSRWLAEEAGKSSLFRNRPCATIPNGLNAEVFAPVDRPTARARLGLPADARIVLFVAATLDNPRKGIGQLVTAIAQLQTIEGLLLLSVGAAPPTLPAGVRARHLGAIADDRQLAAVYSAADVFVISSLADNLPNTILEAMACGTPVVGYACGGITDLVVPLETGLLAETGHPLALAQAIERMLLDPELRRRCSAAGRARILKEHTLEIQARRYLELYARA